MHWRKIRKFGEEVEDLLRKKRLYAQYQMGSKKSKPDFFIEWAPNMIKKI